MPELEKSRKGLANRATAPVVALLARTTITPNTLTWVGFVITVGAAVLIIFEHFLVAGIVVLVAGLFDMLDGALARATGKVTKFGGILDSTLDRLSEAALLLGLLTVFSRQGQTGESILAGVTLLGSLMVSYVRARIEGAGIECKAGIFTRPERVIIMALGLLLAGVDFVLVVALSVIAAMSYITVVERLVFAWRHTRNQ